MVFFVYFFSSFDCGQSMYVRWVDRRGDLSFVQGISKRSISNKVDIIWPEDDLDLQMARNECDMIEMGSFASLSASVI